MSPTSLSVVTTTPEGSGDRKTSTRVLPIISTTSVGYGDLDATSKSVSEMSRAPEVSRDIETSPNTVPEKPTSVDRETTHRSVTETVMIPEGSGEPETKPTNIPEISTISDGYLETSRTSVTEILTSAGSEYTEIAQTNVPEIYTTPEGSGKIETTNIPEISPTLEGSVDAKTTPNYLTKTSTLSEATGDIEKTSTSAIEFITPECSGDMETCQTAEPDISTRFTDISTTAEVSVGVETVSSGLPERYTTSEGSEDTTKTTPTNDSPPQPGTTSPISTEFVITGASKGSKSTHQIVSTPAVRVSSSGIVTINRNSVVSNDISPTEGLTYASTGKRSTSLVTTLGVSGKSSTIELASSVNVNTTKITHFHTSGDFSTLYVTSIAAEGSILTSSAESSKVNTVESKSSTTTIMPTEKTTVGSRENCTIESLLTTRGAGKTLSTSTLLSEPQKTSSSFSASSIISKLSSPLTKAQPLSSEPSSTTIFESSKPSTLVPVTTIFPSAVAITTTRIPIPTTTKITANPNIPTIKPCHNGGFYDGIKCICLENFYGALCEHIIDRVRIGRSVTTTIGGFLRFIHLDFQNNLKDSKSDEYKKFDTDFKKDMKVVYKDVPGYQGVQILSISSGSVVVDYNIIIEIVYKSNISVSQQYKDAIKDVKEALSKIVCSNPDVPNRNCISDEFNVTETDNLESEEELCFSKVPNGFQEFFNSVVDETGLVCVSQCDPMSWKYTNCQDGSCQILNNTGPHCLCPRTDLYIYTSPNCNGRMLKSGVYGGIGAAIGVLLIIICVALVFVTRKEKDKKWDLFANDDKINWFDNMEEDGHVGITNLGSDIDNEDQDSAKNSFSSKKEKFKPNMESIDSTFEFKIERPQVSVGLK
ncbi:uncharacterized protein LOC143774308 [Ranitomeya variabilis]|uniref:uncharacterized protein LOC143774308 n=1 Tax=Ranitomeya variabilis TaxID=490064 RepID=UPI004055DB57